MQGATPTMSCCLTGPSDTPGLPTWFTLRSMQNCPHQSSALSGFDVDSHYCGPSAVPSCYAGMFSCIGHEFCGRCSRGCALCSLSDEWPLRLGVREWPETFFDRVVSQTGWWCFNQPSRLQEANCIFLRCAYADVKRQKARTSCVLWG